jgi:SAM-dependent methyltransferase
VSYQGLEDRARPTAGASSLAVYSAAVAFLDELGLRVETLVDVGCGQAKLRGFLGARCQRYIGVDGLVHGGLPSDVEFVQSDLDTGRVPLPGSCCDLVTCLETIEHVENPRALLRELCRLARPGGLVLVTTPNQLSLLSKLSLVVKNEFVHFQERPGLYPAHISALLEIDLVRIYREVGLLDVQVRYTALGRVPLSSMTWPAPLRARSGFRGRAFSDNVLVLGRKAQPLEPPAADPGPDSAACAPGI